MAYGVGAANAASLCDSAIAAAELGRGMPPGLLRAIARVESGRRDPYSGTLTAWPWTIDVEGEGHVYDTEAEAIAAVRQFQALGHRSIDVGCMQVNLQQHPGAFPSLEAAFDPASNARYAADFLQQLHQGQSDWMIAAGLYHSATPALGAAYRGKLAGMLDEIGARASAWASNMAGPVRTFALAVPPAGSPGSALRGMVLRTPRVAPPAAGGGQPGHGLADYRAAPVRLANWEHAQGRPAQGLRRLVPSWG